MLWGTVYFCFSFTELQIHSETRTQLKLLGNCNKGVQCKPAEGCMSAFLGVPQTSLPAPFCEVVCWTISAAVLVNRHGETLYEGRARAPNTIGTCVCTEPDAATNQPESQSAQGEPWDTAHVTCYAADRCTEQPFSLVCLSPSP